MPSPFLYFAGSRLSLAELSAARLDGHLVELGEGYIPADAIETRSLRAASLEELLAPSLAATHLSAAWIHGALSEPPARHTVMRAVQRRIHHVIDRRLVYRDLAVDPCDLLRIAGVDVTTPVRTLADLARVPDERHIAAALLVAEEDPALVSEAITWLQVRGSVPHKRTALTLLRGIESRSQDRIRRR